MANGSVANNNSRKVLLHRGYTATGSLSATQYLPVTQFQLGIDASTALITDTALDNVVPIADGTVNDTCEDTFTGSSGGDNSTDNTTTYKEGAGTTDVTAQNLIANDTNASKIWTLTPDTNFTGTSRGAQWIYIIDQTALDKFLTSGTAIQIKWGSDSSNYYSKTWEASDLVIGWNFLSTGITAINALTETGTVSGNIDTYIVTITTNNATDEFVAGDVIIDLLRTWVEADTYRDLVSGYPTIDLTNFEATLRADLPTNLGNGFDIDNIGTFNEATTPELLGEDVHASESKTSLDSFAWVIKERIL